MAVTLRREEDRTQFNPCQMQFVGNCGGTLRLFSHMFFMRSTNPAWATSRTNGRDDSNRNPDLDQSGPTNFNAVDQRFVCLPWD